MITENNIIIKIMSNVAILDHKVDFLSEYYYFNYLHLIFQHLLFFNLKLV